MKTDTTIHGWQDFVELCIASWVFVSPFFLGFFDNVAASLSCMLLGGLVISTSIFGMARETPGLEWATVCIAVLLIGSPWAFAYAQITSAVFSVVISGGLILAFSILAMTQEYREMEDTEHKAEPAN